MKNYNTTARCNTSLSFSLEPNGCIFARFCLISLVFQVLLPKFGSIYDCLFPEFLPVQQSWLRLHLDGSILNTFLVVNALT